LTPQFSTPTKPLDPASFSMWGPLQAIGEGGLLGTCHSIQELVDAYKNSLQKMRILGMSYKPKHHQTCHLVSSTLRHGAPHLWGCWRDESLNKHLKMIAVRAHRTVWHRRLLSDFRKGFGVARSVRRKTWSERWRAKCLCAKRAPHPTQHQPQWARLQWASGDRL